MMMLHALLHAISATHRISVSTADELVPSHPLTALEAVDVSMAESPGRMTWSATFGPRAFELIGRSGVAAGAATVLGDGGA